MMIHPKVIVIDDEPGWREIMKDILVEEGYRVCAVDSYSEAEAALEAEVFHLAIIDLKLELDNAAAVSGMDLLELVSKRGTGLPYCIVLTGYPTLEYARESFKKYSVWDFIVKSDFEPQSFLHTVSEAVTEAIKTSAVTELEGLWLQASYALQNTSIDESVNALTNLLSFVSRSLGLPESEFPLLVHQRLLVSRLQTGAIFANDRISHPMLVAALQGSDLLEADLEDMRYILSQTFSQPTYIVLFLITNERQGRKALPYLQKLKQTFSYDIVLLNYSDVTDILTAKEPSRQFRQLVLSQITLTAISPFITTGPALGRIFFGREHEIREIIEHAYTDSYALIGGRRIGKTSLLKQLERVHFPTLGFRALYHDCSFTPTQNELVQAVILDKTWFPTTPDVISTSFAEIIQELHNDKPLIILLDEIDKLIASDRTASYILFKTLRGMANSGVCRFIFSGEIGLHAELVNPVSPLYNFAKELIVGRLDYHAVRELVIRPMKDLEVELIDAAQMVQHIWDFTSGHPNVVQRYCQRLINRLNDRGDRRLSMEDVKDLAADPDFLRKDFLTVYWERASILERLCSLIMAANEEARTLTTIYDNLISHDIETTLNNIDNALERLVDLRNILKRTSKGYDFAVTAFPEIIAKTSRLDDLIALNRETYHSHGDVEPGLFKNG